MKQKKFLKNRVYIVGAGPGSPDLITIRGLKILKEADVIIYDYLVNKKILEEARENAELIECEKSDRKKISKIIIDKVKEGKKVVRLKNGCPSIFSRLSQELEALVENGIEFEIVPGITSATAASCLTGIPLTDRRFSSSCVFVTGQEDPEKKKSLIDWSSIVKSGTIVLYMSVGNLKELIEKIIEAGRSEKTPVAVIKDVSLITQKIVKGNLKNIVEKVKKENIRPPAIVIIGEVVKLEKKLKPLKKSKKILYLGLSKERFFLREKYYHYPVIQIKPLDDYTELDLQLLSLKSKKIFDWIVFTSRYGVEYFFKRMKVLNLDSRNLSGVKIAAIGNSTKNKLLEFGIIADLVPEKESSEGLFQEFKKIDIRGKRILLPRSDISDKGLEEKFKKLGAKVETVFAYRNVMPDNLVKIDLKSFDEIFFTSPSTVRNFCKIYGRVPETLRVRTIGEVTEREARKFGLLREINERD